MAPRVLETYRTAFRGLSREVWILSLVSLVNRCGTMVVVFLVPYLTAERGYSPSDAGLLLSLYGLGTIGGIALGGRLSDRVGPGPVIVGSLLATGALMFLLGALREPAAIAVGVVALGVAGEAFRPAIGVAITEASGELERPRAFGLLRLSLNLGMTIGPALGGFLAEVDYAWLFRVDGATCVLAGGLFWWLSARHARRPQEEEAPEPLPHAWRDRRFAAAMALTFVQALAFFQLMSTYPLYLLEERGYREAAFGALFAVNTILIVLFEMVLVQSIQRRDPLRVAAVAGLAIGVGFGLTPWATSTVALVGTIVIWTLGEMLFAPIMQSWVATRAAPRSRGQYLAGFAMVFSVASVVAPWLGTKVYEEVSPDAVWHACIGLGLVQTVGFLALARSGRKGRTG